MLDQRRAGFPARYSSNCPACDGPIREGDHINLTDEGYQHSDCEDAYVPPIESPTCTACWLRHPIGECDRD